MADGVATVELNTVVSYLETNWKRTALATFSQGITIPDPGHGHDEISPIMVIGIPFDPDVAADVSPFVPTDLYTHQASGVVIEGTGWIGVRVNPLGNPEVMSPGNPPELRRDSSVNILIVTPSGRGPALANNYAGALSEIFRYKTFVPTSNEVSVIRNLTPPAEYPIEEGDDGTWRYDRLDILLATFYRAPLAA